MLSYCADRRRLTEGYWSHIIELPCTAPDADNLAVTELFTESPLFIQPAGG
ncbi:hypothetical protein [Erwinia sorbitola]|uniref:Uncharacterized protein n=1 Tax=Erwinia sorbitola TaxID=2681984 RepID=A0A6I6ECK0_9GAMM|nr:hypothetical protein [Erwinia sorbitola]QGU86358.1 hypothetical protein GN242_03570 [Erwinia sorbitola]